MSKIHQYADILTNSGGFLLCLRRCLFVYYLSLASFTRGDNPTGERGSSQAHSPLPPMGFPLVAPLSFSPIPCAGSGASFGVLCFSGLLLSVRLRVRSVIPSGEWGAPVSNRQNGKEWPTGSRKWRRALPARIDKNAKSYYNRVGQFPSQASKYERTQKP